MSGEATRRRSCHCGTCPWRPERRPVGAPPAAARRRAGPAPLRQAPHELGRPGAAEHPARHPHHLHARPGHRLPGLGHVHGDVRDRPRARPVHPPPPGRGLAVRARGQRLLVHGHRAGGRRDPSVGQGRPDRRRPLPVARAPQRRPGRHRQGRARAHVRQPAGDQARADGPDGAVRGAAGRDPRPPGRRPLDRRLAAAGAADLAMVTGLGESPAGPAWGSDVMADVVAALGIRYVSLNPGSSYRGLHDSLVNRVADHVEMICCPHEKVAVGIAHGYAKVTGEPMAAILHDVVGLLHGAMGIYYAHLDRAPVLVLGGAGPAEQARRRCQARRPVVVPGFAGRDPAAFGQLVELAELVGAGVDDTGVRLNFPNRHPLCVNGTGALEQADCVLFLDVKDMGKPTQRLDSTTRSVTSRLARGATVLDLGFNDLGLSSWSEDYAALIETDVQVTADTVVALPMLVEACRRLVAGDDDARRSERAAYLAELRELHAKTRDAWAREAATRAGGSPVSTPRLATEVWGAIREHDWVLTAGTAAEWARKLWDFDAPHRHPGRSLGTATQIGISLGVALAHRGTGRLVVD